MDKRPRPDAEDLQRTFAAKVDWHRRQARLPLPEKVRILLALQRQDYPLLARRRTMEWWERPWEIDA
jgi:hypothetical protein